VVALMTALQLITSLHDNMDYVRWLCVFVVSILTTASPLTLFFVL
jgi:hypothetical protein